ncbi:type V CRISPR-associated protein Cas12k [Rivularia sp. UHCC 0363]|uniref:type V CRISPR-associated protein Cas12k n=1 Tax=Rivularia sp. UHCC 0363 TaxID=3110244 RepID=UPI002B205723|nr:type V CRISPR-associated protein Cas12k [Rivularia sp. UHCC 0363]MEA5596750.1 type V CRISPR-associated protein Cas12k [Rivularia sp. UHCC 0363]
MKRKNSSLARINNPFPRPSKSLYKGQPHILLGVSLGLEKSATVAVVDVILGKVLTYRSIKQLLGDNYKLLNRQRQQKQAMSHARQIAQIQASPNQYGDSELGEYIDRLLAKKIIAIAQKYSATSIVLPKLDGMREQVNIAVPTYELNNGQENFFGNYRQSFRLTFGWLGQIPLPKIRHWG